MTVTAVLPAAFAFVAMALIALPLLLGFLAGLRPSSGGPVNRSRTRLWAGLGTIALAALVAGIGWYRISGEPLLNRQIPLLASAGLVVVVLSVVGGALIVSEQLRGDQGRLQELEEAVRSLTEALSPSIELPARREELSSPRARASSARRS
jgi:hypothetical protein